MNTWKQKGYFYLIMNKKIEIYSILLGTYTWDVDEAYTMWLYQMIREIKLKK